MASLEFDLDRDALPEQSLPSEAAAAAASTPAATSEAEKEEDFHDVVDEEEDETSRRVREATEWKSKGNDRYKLKDFEGALECYGTALQVCPGESERTPKAIVEVEPTSSPAASEGIEAAESSCADGEVGTAASEEGEGGKGASAAAAAATAMSPDGAPAAEEAAEKDEEERGEAYEPLSAESARHAEQRSVLHCNRAACLQQLERHEDACDECSLAIGLQPQYAKALLRRAQAHEALERFQEAIGDLTAVLALDPASKLAAERKAKLEAKEAERMEKLKAETLGKLKELGNSILGNFGMSTDNFKFEQDPTTGSYNMQFVQNP